MSSPETVDTYPFEPQARSMFSAENLKPEIVVTGNGKAPSGQPIKIVQINTKQK